jgi:hypothetical protein
MKQLLTFCLILLICSSYKNVKPYDNLLVTNSDWQTSTSFTKNDQGQISTAKPKIKITESHIIVHHRTEGGGKITNTTLQGTGGTYTLQEGDNQINPGEYTHSVIGTIVGSGGIYSDVTYK